MAIIGETVNLKGARKVKGWTQQEAAEKLGVSQAYLSLLESGRRRPSPRVLNRLTQLFDLPATAVPPRHETVAPSPSDLAAALAALGYQPFQHFARHAPLVNPAELLLGALQVDSLEPRVAEALPWLVNRYPDLDWTWLLPRVKANDRQNRLGFVVSLARDLAEKRGESGRAEALRSVEATLERSKLVREDVFGRSFLTASESRWLHEHRPEEARHWNVLSNMRSEHLHGF
jgi:transcriptional regulator with XRE-family HTH domain